jgi:CPA1 family monovalent cation:H+ antiporter
MEVLLVNFSVSIFVAAAVAMAVTLAARALTVGLPVSLLERAFKLPKGSGWVLTWGGLRGGISVALALSLPAGPERNIVLAMTYCIVVLSIIGQGLTIGRVVRAAVTERR